MLSDEAAEAMGDELCEELAMVWEWLIEMADFLPHDTPDVIRQTLVDRAEAIRARFGHLKAFGGDVD